MDDEDYGEGLEVDEEEVERLRRSMLRRRVEMKMERVAEKAGNK